MLEFYKSKLNKKDQQNYESALNSFKSMRFEVDMQASNAQDLITVYSAILYDHPELFYLTQRPNVGQRLGLFGFSFTFISSCIFSTSEVMRYNNELYKIAKDFQKQTENLKTDEEKILLLCDYFLKNVSYEINNDLNQNCATVFMQRKGQCSGIAKAVKFILDYIGIDCIIIDGEAWSNGQGGLHAWNIVWINGVPYHLDVTNMMGANPSKSEPFYYLYYLASDAEMVVHSWEKSKYPKCDKQCLKKPKKAQNGQGFTQGSASGNTRSSASSYSGKIIKFSIEMEKEIKKAIDTKEKTLCFSTALCLEGQELLDEVNKTIKKITRQNNLALTFRVTVRGYDVEIIFE